MGYSGSIHLLLVTCFCTCCQTQHLIYLVVEALARICLYLIYLFIYIFVTICAGFLLLLKYVFSLFIYRSCSDLHLLSNHVSLQRPDKTSYVAVSSGSSSQNVFSTYIYLFYIIIISSCLKLLLHLLSNPASLQGPSRNLCPGKQLLMYLCQYSSSQNIQML